MAFTWVCLLLSCSTVVSGLFVANQHNSELPGVAFRDVNAERLYPSVGMKKPGEHLRANFGQLPFVFDIDGLMEVSSLIY